MIPDSEPPPMFQPERTPGPVRRISWPSWSRGVGMVTGRGDLSNVGGFGSGRIYRNPGSVLAVGLGSVRRIMSLPGCDDGRVTGVREVSPGLEIGPR